MKKIVLSIALFALIFTFPAFSLAVKETDVKTTLLKIQEFTTEQNAYLSQQLESMMALLGQVGTYNQVQKIKQTLLMLLEDAKKNTTLAGEVLKKEKLEEKDISLFIDRITLPIATISLVSQTYGIILSKEKRKINRILEKIRKERDNKSA